MPYEMQWGGTHPGCLIILLDQSGSMNDPFGGTQLGAGKKKADMVATVLNRLLHELIKGNTVGSEIKRRADVAVLGYSGDSVVPALAGATSNFTSLPELMASPLRIETRTRKEMDDTGQVIEIPDYFPIWVEPKAEAGTPMRSAFRKAKELASDWAASHPNNYPPVVINITDGMATDCSDLNDLAKCAAEVSDSAKEVTSISTTDGNLLLFNCHITDKSDAPIEFPSSENALPNDYFAKLLFSTSSVLPEASGKLMEEAGQTVAPGARGFIFNGDANSVRQIVKWGTIAAQPGIDANM